MYIHEKIDLWRIEFCSLLRPRAVSRLRARRDYKVATLSALRAELRSELEIKGGQGSFPVAHHI